MLERGIRLLFLPTKGVMQRVPPGAAVFGGVVALLCTGGRIAYFVGGVKGCGAE
jgi:hypothetical protein